MCYFLPHKDLKHNIPVINRSKVDHSSQALISCKLKDVALQFLGFVFEYLLARRNQQKSPAEREHLTVIGATSGDTGSAAIYGLRAKKDVSIIILYPDGRISPVQEAQMTSVLDANVHNLAVDGTFDDCQDFVKALFGDEDIKTTHQLAAVNSINWARILAQITYYFYSYSCLIRDGRIKKWDRVRYSVPSGNFGDVLAGFFAKKMGLPIEKLVVATNENDILYRFWKTGYYEKKPVHWHETNVEYPEDGAKAHEDGVKESLSAAMNILVSSNFERLLWFLAFDVYGEGSIEQKRKIAGEKVKRWLQELKTDGGFGVEPKLLEAAKVDFESERVSDKETLASIKSTYKAKTQTVTMGTSKGTVGTTSHGGYILDPHSAIGVAAASRSLERAKGTQHISLATAHPAKFSNAVEEALKGEVEFNFQDLLPEQFRGLEDLPRRKTLVRKAEGIEGMRKQIRDRVPASGSV